MVSKKTGFGLRLKEAFGNATNGVIGRKIGVAENTVGSYVRGRIPDADTLITIANVTGRSIDWLLTGSESLPKVVEVEREIFDPIIDRSAMQAMIREIVREAVNLNASRTVSIAISLIFTDVCDGVGDRTGIF